MKLDDDHTSAEMERLRVRLLWRAFAGGSDPSGPRSMLGRGLLTSIVLAGLLAVGTFVAGVIAASTSGDTAGRGAPVTPTTSASPTPSTRPGPAPSTTAATTTASPPPPPTTEPPPPPPPQRVEVAVSSTEPWTDSGLDVTAGDEVQVAASGTVAAAVGNPTANVGPDGSVNPDFVGSNRNENGAQVRGGHAALIGMVGEGTPFLIGAAKTLHVETEGRLLLGVNDNGLDNNDGQFAVTLTVQRAADS